MSANSANAPAWLFSFLDLAFLILIAVLLTADGEAEEREPALDVATIELPEIQRSSTEPAALDAGEPWQLRVHPRTGAYAEAPFAVSRSHGAPELELETSLRVGRDELGATLLDLAGRGFSKPFLAPHRDSRSEDFLTALGFVQEYWPEQHVAAVFPRTQSAAVPTLTPTPAVSAGPGGELLP